MKNILLLLFTVTNFFLIPAGYAQCPATCDFTYDGSTTSFTLNGGKTLCITTNSTSSDLNISISGSTANVICIAPGVTWTQSSGMNINGPLIINNYGTFNMNGSYNVNGGATFEVNNNAGGTLNTDSQGFGAGVTIRNSSNMTWTATNNINNSGTFMLYNDTPTAVMTATATSLFKIGNGNTFENYGTFTVSNLENEEAIRFYNDAGGKVSIGRYFFNHGAFLNEGLVETICGNFGSVACEFIVGDKGPGKEYINSGCMKVKGDVSFNGPGKLNEGTLIIEDGNLTINKQVTGTNGRIVVLNGTSTISLSGGFNGTNMKFCDQNTAGNAFDAVNANNEATTVVYTVDCSVTDCGSAPVCIQPVRLVQATNPTCAVAGKIELISTNGDKYGVSKGATYTGPAYAAATAVGTLPVILKNNISHAADSTFTIRVFNAANDCFKDTTVTVAALPVITVPVATAICHANGTPEDAADDYMTFSIKVNDTPVSLHTYTVTATQGGNPLVVTLSNGSAATSVLCGLNTALRTPAGSAGKGNVTLTITDNVTGCTQTLVITDPGTCAVACVEGTPSTVSYQYATQVDVTDLDKLPIILPKFDEQGGSRVLTSVKLEYEVGGKTAFIFENRAAQSQTFEATGTSEATIELNGSNIDTSMITMPIPETTLSGGILVPAGGNWLGDVLQSGIPTTLGRMSSWVSDYLTAFKDPRTDPRWVTNATRNATDDDDMYLAQMVEGAESGSFTYTTVGELAPFIGTGSVPLNVSTLSGLSLAGGGGNIFAIQRTRAYASAKVTYTFECVELCVKPVATATLKTQSVCVGGTASAYTVTPNTGVEYKWYGPLADTTSSLGTAITGQTMASYTPTGAALTTAGTKYYAVIVNTTGDVTCADTAFVQLQVRTLAITAIASSCEPGTNKFSVSGQITFNTPPSTGVLRVRISGKAYKDFQPPFSSPINYTLTGLNSDGLADTVEVMFSDGVCKQIAVYNAPAMCLPNVCIGTEVAGKSTYTFTIPLKRTNWNDTLSLPKFDDMGGARTLKNVLLTVNQSIVNWGVAESSDNEDTEINIETTGTTSFKLDGNDFETNSFTATNYPKNVTRAVLVPAVGTWPGDNTLTGNPSTLLAMSSTVNNDLNNLIDPTLSPTWVTNQTGDPTDDDDMTYFAPVYSDNTKCWLYSNVADLAKFIGTGNAELTVRATGSAFVSGAGNIVSLIRTSASAEITVTYLYCQTNCVKPVALATPKTQSVCIGSTASAYTVTPNTGVEYKWYGPLADTTSNLGTAITGQTMASYTPTGAALTTAGTKYYAVIVNTTGDVTCADTAFVQLVVNAKPTIANGTATICEGETVDLTSKITNYATLLSPVWTVAGGATVATPKSVSPTATTTYVLVAQNDAGCKDTAEVVVTVNSKPTIATANGFPACRQNGTSYTIKFIASAGTVTTVPGLTVTGDSIANIPLATASVRLIITSPEGCKDSIDVTAPVCDKPVGSIGDLIWKDINDNGLQDLPSESGVAGIKVNLYAAAAGTKTGAVLQTKTTGTDGLYLFTGLMAGDYIVEIDKTTVPDTCEITAKQNTPSDDTKDSDFNPSTGLSQVITLNPVFNPTTPSEQLATNNLTVDAGLTAPCVKSKVTVTAAPVCSADVQTYSLSFSVSNKVGMVKVDKGVLTGSNPYTVTGIPSGATVKITDSLSAVCKFDTLITGPNCNCNPPLPILLTPSLTACIGDTFPTIKATVVGMATVEWFTAASGGTAIASGLSYKPAGVVTGDTVFYAQARSTDPSCPAAISTSRVMATVNAQNCTVEVDLALRKSINTKIAQIGDELTYTIKVFNQLNTAATGVEVADSIATTVQFVAGSFTASRGSAIISGNVIKWTIGGIAANAGADGDTVMLTYKVKATQEGVHFNTAEISKTNEKDIDSTPGNGMAGEDDIESQCFTVPFKLCPGEKVQVNVPGFLTNVQWFKNGGTTSVGSGNEILFSEAGSYSYTASNQACPANGCCPVIIEPGDNCCPEDLCIPFTIKKRKK